MAVFKSQSLKYTIAKIYRDLRLEDPNYEYDIIEWAGEALDFIGAGAQFELNVVDLPIVEYRVQMPTGLMSINQIAYSESDDVFHIIKYNGKTFPDKYHDPNSKNLQVSTAQSYFIQPDYIICSEEEGTLRISYMGIALDDQGYPLVPDNQYYREAIFWYCFKHLLMLGYQSAAGIDYQFAESKWLFYCTGARNKANYPSLSQYEQFKQSWASLIPNTTAYSEGFDNKFQQGIEFDVVNASNLITSPISVESPE